MTTPGAPSGCAIVGGGVEANSSADDEKDRRSGGRVGQRARQGEKDTLCPLMTPGIRLVSDIEKITRHGMKGRPRLSAAVEHEDDTG